VVGAPPVNQGLKGLRATTTTPGRGTAAAYGLLRRHVPFIELDCVMYPYIEAARRLVADGSIVAAVAAALG